MKISGGINVGDLVIWLSVPADMCGQDEMIGLVTELTEDDGLLIQWNGDKAPLQYFQQEIANFCRRGRMRIEHA